MIEVAELHKSYGSVHAVRGISFEVERGRLYGFLGPNGAGKSTTLRILAGFLGATSGTVRIDGCDIVDQRLEAARRIGYMPETSPLYPEMRVDAYLRFRAELKGVPRRRRKAEVERVVEMAGVSEMADTSIGALSKGYRQRVGLADALVGRPPLLILDEPTSGLDPNQIGQVRALLRELRDEHTILLSTHILSEVEASCERALVIHRGRLVAEGPIEELRRAGARGRIELTVTRPEGMRPKALLALLRGVEGVKKVSRQGAGDVDRLSVRVSDDPDRGAERLAFALSEAGVGLRRLTPAAASLEEVFAELTAEQRREEEAE